MPDPVTPTPAAAPSSAGPTDSPRDPTKGMSLADAFQAMQTGRNPDPQGAAPSSTVTPPAQPTPGQAPVAPAGGQGDGKGGPKGPDGAAPDKGQAAPVLTPEAILEQLGPTETPDAKLARVQREAGASRAESLRRKKVEEGLQSLMAGQDLEIVYDESGIPKALAPGKNYAGGKAADFTLKFTELTAEQQERYEKDPQALIDLALSRAKKALVRASPTVEKAIQPISPEHEQAIVEHVAGLLHQDGATKKHAALKDNLPIIRQFLQGPQNVALREFFYQQPDLALGMLDTYVESVKSFLSAAAARAADAKKKKETEATSTFVPGPQGGGEPVIVADGASAEEAGKAWAKRFGQARSY